MAFVSRLMIGSICLYGSTNMLVMLAFLVWVPSFPDRHRFIKLPTNM